MQNIEFTTYRPNSVDISFEFNGKEVNFAEAKSHAGQWYLIIPDTYAKTTDTERFPSKGEALDAAAELAREWIRERSA